MAEPIRQTQGEQRELHPTWEPVLEAGRERVESGEHREAVHDAVRERIESAQQRIAATPTQAAKTDDHAQHVKQLAGLKEPQQVAYLGKIALEDGIEKAVRLAKRTSSEYVVDALHDLLADELAVELERRHKL